MLNSLTFTALHTQAGMARALVSAKMTVKHWSTTQEGSDGAKKQQGRPEDQPESQMDINTHLQRP